MKNATLYLLAIISLFSILTACSNQEPQSLADESADVALEITSRSLDIENQEDIQFLLVRKWENAQNDTYLDLKHDSSFEGVLQNEEMVFGTWSISQDQKTLKLNGNQGQEGKGKVFQASYSIIEMSFDNMKVKNEEGVELAFTASK